MKEVPLNLTITPFGSEQAVTLKTFDEAEAWLQEQRTKWQQFHRYIDQHGVIRSHHNAIANAKNAVSTAKADNSREDGAAALRKLEQPPFLSVDGTGAELINESLKAGDWQTSAAIYMLWTNPGGRQDFSRMSIDLIRLLRAAAMWRDSGGSIGLAAVNYRKALNTRLGKWEAEFKDLSEKAKALLDQTGAEHGAAITRQTGIEESLRTLHTGFKEQLETLNAEHGEKLTRLHSEHDDGLATLHQTQSDALNQLNKTYLEHLRLKAPAEYWTNKAMKHAASATKWLWWLLGFIGAGLIGLAAFLYWNFYSLIDHVSTKSANTTAVVLLALPALLYLTLVRVAHKSYRDEVRHAVDAEQRSTLVQTYLALTTDNGSGVEPGERLLALHALFRGSAQADSPDDTPPINSLEAIIQSLKPKSH